MKFYVPEDNTYNKCYVIQNEDIIRGYDRVPSNNTNYNYRDYYIHSDYIYKDGVGNWSQYSTLPICLSSSVLTNDSWYRLDITNVLINFTILVLFCIYLPFRIVKSLFGRRLS